MDSTPATLFTKAANAGASDVHIAVDTPILFRIDGELVPQSKQVVTAAGAEHFVKAILGDELHRRLKDQREVDAAFELKDGVRLRVNCHYERGNVSLAARIVPNEIPTIEEVGLQGIAEQLCRLSEGLVLFTGPTGEGKSTSLAAMIQFINEDRAVNIVTLEDPIEFIFPKGKGVIRQRQFCEDFLSFAEALKRILRQDPDVIMVGEMRDPETIAAALTLAETGHLVLATLHTPNTAQTIDRIIDVFPPHQQSQIRSQLSFSLKAVVAQKLLPREGGGRIALREILLNVPAVANIIRDSRLHELKSVLQTHESVGMVAFEKAAKRLYKEGVISKEVYEYAVAAL
jgi:twitching motility protein PilT